MEFTQPRLPYPADALAPVISQETIEFHYGKHEKAYIETLNNLIKDTDYDGMPLEDIIRKSDGKLFNNASQAWNHIFYFFQFSPDGLKEPGNRLRDAIDRDFGGFDAFRRKFEEAGATLFGSGWVWLCADDKGHLFIKQCSNAGNPMTEGLKPLLVADVWEHAYYLDYQNRRADHLKALWDIIDWNVVEMRYE